MSSQPPSSDRPTGPPSGPLSGGRPSPAPEAPTEVSPTPPPGSVPPEPPSGGGGGGGGGDEGGGGSGGGPEGPAQGPGEGPGVPWWRSVPKVATIAAAIVAATVLIVVLTRPDDGNGGDASGSSGEVFLQAASADGIDPFTESSDPESQPPSAPPPTLPSAPETDANVTRGVEGSAPGLYGGTQNVASCDVEQQIKLLTAEQDKNRAFASVLEIEPSDVPSYLRALTPVRLRTDTRVTNHGYQDGAATSYQAVLQAGTAVLVDERGVPRVRCACGNPLTPPVALRGDAQRKGDSWPDYRPSNVVAVTPAPTVVNVFVILDLEDGGWFEREKGDTGENDEPTTAPTSEPSPTTTTQSPSPTRCPSGTTPSPTATEADAAPTCVPVSPSPDSPSPTDTSPTATPPTDGTGPPPDDATTEAQPDTNDATAP
ncbi:DUF6777 domain-containing protein [Streptomyces apocyni]|uniref:DUF6777 domain-containing protein n=1 Tax=Streptomyces apocyni TaxID=2654677 RepID=UPI0012EAB6D3|nr:DUF6777 domain-containing protein [Streptomyces apocyni]